MHQKYFPKNDRLHLMQRSDAIATLGYLCKIGESDFATQIAARNPRWGLKIVDEKVIYSTVSHA